MLQTALLLKIFILLQNLKDDIKSISNYPSAYLLAVVPPGSIDFHPAFSTVQQIVIVLIHTPDLMTQYFTTVKYRDPALLGTLNNSTYSTPDFSLIPLEQQLVPWGYDLLSPSCNYFAAAQAHFENITIASEFTNPKYWNLHSNALGSLHAWTAEPVTLGDLTTQRLNAGSTYVDNPFPRNLVKRIVEDSHMKGDGVDLENNIVTHNVIDAINRFYEACPTHRVFKHLTW